MVESSAAAIGEIYDAIRVEGVGNNEALIPQGPLGCVFLHIRSFGRMSLLNRWSLTIKVLGSFILKEDSQPSLVGMRSFTRCDGTTTYVHTGRLSKVFYSHPFLASYWFRILASAPSAFIGEGGIGRTLTFPYPQAADGRGARAGAAGGDEVLPLHAVRRRGRSGRLGDVGAVGDTSGSASSSSSTWNDASASWDARSDANVTGLSRCEKSKS